MLKVEHINVVGIEPAIRGMRNPKNSWDRIDSKFNVESSPTGMWLGANDLDLMNRLVKAGTEHRKFMRMIAVYMDITAPLYWWKEFDTYKVGTVANSCSTMHKIQAKEFTLDDFSCEHLFSTCLLENVIDELNIYRSIYNNYDKQTDDYKKEFSKKDIWWQMIQLLPSNYNQKRTVMMNYEVAARIIEQRKNHKLDEWHTLCDELIKLPYMEDLIGGKE